MSLILDALRKIELERKAKLQSSQEVRSEVLNYRRLTPPVEKSRIVPITVLLLVSTAVACFFYFKKQESPKNDSLPHKESLIQQPIPVIPQHMPQLQQPASALPAQKSPQAEEERPAQPVKPSTGAVIVKQGNGDGITVSGIAWQDERSLRRAVINGFLVGEGAEIQGAKIIEIKESRVRFSRGSEVFEVVHTSGAGK
jgi:general secretion pathway protein B